MSNIDIKFLFNSDIKTILEKYYSKPVLYKFVSYSITYSQQFYDHKKFADVKGAQDKILQILGDLILGKEVSVKEIQAPVAADAASAAYAAVSDAAYAANAAADNVAANAAYYAHQAAYDAANAAYASRADANHANAAFGATIAVQKNYLIKLVLEENNVDTKTFEVLYEKG